MVPNDKSYILAGKKAFFYRFCDSGFRNKWTGLWGDGKKYLDYFAVRIGDAWLSPQTCKDVNYNQARMIHRYEFGGNRMFEILFVPEDKKSLVLFLKADEEINPVIEVAANIRDRKENYHTREYSIEQRGDKIILKSESGCLVIKGAKLLKKGFYKEHEQDGETQRNFVFECEARGRETTLIFGCGDDEESALQEVEFDAKKSLTEKEKLYHDVSNQIECNDKELEKAFKKCIADLEMLKSSEDGLKGYRAGFPWFTDIWGRDSGWVIPAAICAGDFEFAREALSTLAKKAIDGCVPNYIGKESAYNTIDANPLWIIALHKYVLNSGDVAFLRKNASSLTKVLKRMEMQDVDKDGYLEHDLKEKDTWMDTINRSINAVEVQALYVEALKCCAELFSLLSRKNENLLKKAILIENKMKKQFWSEKSKLYADRVKTNDELSMSLTPNGLFCCLFNNNNEMIGRIKEKDFTTSVGVRSLSSSDKDYDPKAYHQGQVWSFLTGIAAAIDCRNGGRMFLDMLVNDLKENCLDAVTEVWDGDSLQPAGCCFQGWGAGMLIRAVDEYMLGIEVDAINKKITVKPRLPDGVDLIKRKIRIGKEFVELTFERNRQALINATDVELIEL